MRSGQTRFLPCILKLVQATNRETPAGLTGRYKEITGAERNGVLQGKALHFRRLSVTCQPFYTHVTVWLNLVELGVARNQSSIFDL